MSQPILLIGHEGSPYSRKLRALCRYRHIPFRWVVDNGPECSPPPPLKVKLLPIVVTLDEQGEAVAAATDSTPLIRRFEQEYAGRSVLPPDPALAFLAALLEDYADEWCTKFMFHYRWHDQQDIDWAGRYLIEYVNPALPAAQRQAMANAFAQRQIGRLWVVGSNPQTAPVIEAGYRRVLGLLQSLIGQQTFLFGARPSSADFALFGQFSQLCEFDPTPMQIARSEAPGVVAWCRRVEDLSGWPARDDDWLARDVAATALEPLLAELGRGYIPFMRANASALTAGADEVRCTIDDTEWVQQPFPYQRKCLAALQQQFGQLRSDDQAWLRDLLGAQGCDELLTP